MKGKSIILAALLVCSVLAGGVAVTGSAVAQTTDTATPTDTNDALADQTFTVDNDTRAIEALAENSTAVLDVTVYGVDSSGNETQVDTGTLDATANTTASYQYTNLDPSTYDSYRIVVDGGDASTVEVNKVQLVSGGGGGLLGGFGGNVSLTGAVGAFLVVVGIVAAALYSGRY